MVSGRADYTQDVDAEITNASIDVDASGSSIDANITNADINVSQTGAWDVGITGTPTFNIGASNDVNIASTTGDLNVSVQNASIDVAQSGAWTINANQSGSWEVTFPSAQEVTFPSAQDVTVNSGSIEATFPSAQDIVLTSSTTKVNIFSTGDNVEQHKISIDDTSTTQSWSNAIKSFIFYNDGPNPCHLNFGGAATTDHFIIRARQTFGIDLTSTDTRFICASGESCTIYALGMYD